VQIVWSSRRGARQIEHLGSAHDDGELEAVRAAGRERIAAGQQALTWIWVPMRARSRVGS